jgi:hypothetical protein
MRILSALVPWAVVALAIVALALAVGAGSWFGGQPEWLGR